MQELRLKLLIWRPVPPAEDIVTATGAVGHGQPLIHMNEFTTLPTPEVATVVDFFTGLHGHDCLLLPFLLINLFCLPYVKGIIP
jgi:hypothetical protein